MIVDSARESIAVAEARRLEIPIVAIVDIAHTGDWGKFMENKAKLTPTPGRHDVYLVLTNPKKGGGLMNVDWVEFSQ